MSQKYCNREDECPYCESNNVIDIEITDVDDDYKWELWTCDDCKRDFEVEYVVTYEYNLTNYKDIPLNKQKLFDKGLRS